MDRRFETVLVEVDDAGIATLTLDRPHARNALAPQMADELVEALAALSADPALRVLVLRGAGEHFCAGGDVKHMADRVAAGPRPADEALAAMGRYRCLTMALARFERPVIAAVDGVCFGAGLSLALLADLVLLSDRARLCLAFQRVGLVPDCGALYTLPRHIGLPRAKALALSAREFDAQEALAMGLALEVLPASQLHRRAAEWASELARASPTALALTKRALDQSLHSDLETMLALEASSQATAMGSAEHQAAVQRFRRPGPPLGG